MRKDPNTEIDDVDELTDEERRRRENLNSPTPEVTGLRSIAPAGSLADTQSRLERLKWEDTHPWGSPENHPGTLGKIAHGLAKVGNIAGDIVAPATMSLIPGTELHRQAEEGTLTRRLGEQQKEASEEGLRKIQGENLQSEIEARKNPKPKLLSGEENVATDPSGNRFRAYEMPDNSIAWGAEGGAPPSLRPIAPATQPTGGIAPIAGAGGLPTGATVGKPKTETAEQVRENFLKISAKPEAERTDQEKTFYQTHEAEFAGITPIGADRAKQYTAQINTTLKGSGVDPGAYAVTEKSTLADAKEALAAAQREASQSRSLHAPDEAQARKDARLMGYAMDENGQLKYMSKADADKIHSTFEEMKTGDVNKDRQALRQLNDVQMNTSRYRKAINSFTGPIPADQVDAMQRVLAGVNQSDVEKMGYLTLGALMNMMEQGEVGKSWNNLSKPGRDAVIGYLRAKGSVIAYQKALSGIGRTNKEQMDIEMANLPEPYIGATVGNPRLDSWQENIDRAADGFPENLPGVKHPKAIRESVEGGPAGGHSFTFNGTKYENVPDALYQKYKGKPGFSE